MNEIKWSTSGWERFKERGTKEGEIHGEERGVGGVRERLRSGQNDRSADGKQSEKIFSKERINTTKEYGYATKAQHCVQIGLLADKKKTFLFFYSSFSYSDSIEPHTTHIHTHLLHKKNNPGTKCAWMATTKKSVVSRFRNRNRKEWKRRSFDMRAWQKSHLLKLISRSLHLDFSFSLLKLPLALIFFLFAFLFLFCFSVCVV